MIRIVMLKVGILRVVFFRGIMLVWGCNVSSGSGLFLKDYNEDDEQCGSEYDPLSNIYRGR